MPQLRETFNRSGFSKFINSPAGRIFRVLAGLAFLTVGSIYHRHTLGVVAQIWSLFPLSAGALDICYLSAVLGGPLSGPKIRITYQ